MNPYLILNINKNSTKEEIKKAYMKMALKYHPDRNKTKSEEEQLKCEEKFKEINEAYTILSDGSQPLLDDTNFFSNFKDGKYNDIAERVIKEAALFGKYFFDIVEENTENINVNLNIELFDIYNNIEKNFTLKIKKKCKGCMGMGMSLINKEFITCDRCIGLKYMDYEKEFKIYSGEGRQIFFKQAHEEYGKKNGNIVVNIIPKTNNKYKIVNSCDLILNINHVDNHQFQHLDNKSYKLPDLIHSSTSNKIYIVPNMGLYDHNMERGKLFIEFNDKTYDEISLEEINLKN